jgi:protein-tyrosine phosphatase
MKKVRVLMICMGNICRSPLAEGTFKTLVAEKGLSDQIDVESAGTHFYHVGNLPDSRSIEVAKTHEIDITDQRSAQLCADDFITYDYLMVMDKRNLRDGASLAPSPEAAEKLQLFLDFSREALPVMEVPDPYHDDNGFEHVFQLVSSASRGLLEHILENDLKDA